METGDKVLSQAEIDAMFSAVAQGGGDAPPPVKQSDEPVTPPPIREAPAEGAALSTGDLTKRLEKLEEGMVKLGREDGTAPDIGQAVQQIQQDIQTLAGHLQTLNTKIDSTVAGLSGTVGYAAHDNFECEECHAKGTVAAQLTSTSCSKQSWWGWFPPK